MVTPLPTRILAGVTIPDTPLITKAIELARANLSDFTYNRKLHITFDISFILIHLDVIRCWLFGRHLSTALHLPQHDLELHAISALLHDMGWAFKTPFVSADKRFEVDGANAVRSFLLKEGNKNEWGDQRIQIAWDSIALHTTPSIAFFKEPEVMITCLGVTADFTGPGRNVAGVGVLAANVWDEVVKEFPRGGYREGIKDVLCGLCRDKPNTTYDNFVSEFGVAYVEGYSLEGKKFLDLLAAAED